MPDQGILRDILGLFGSKHAQLQPNFSFQCGQYLYLNIPSISPVEWHPFTISSAPSDGMITCHIKMAPAGRNTFTGKLLSLAEAAGSGAVESKDICVNVDGPYGEWLDPARFDSLLLVAGGIGVTPIHSIFREIRSLMMKNGSSSASLSSTRICQRVHLVWTVQRLSAFEPFVETLKEALADDLGGRLRVSIHCDAQLEPGDTQSYQGLPVFGGRPDVPALVKALATETLPAGLRPHVFVCGPPGLAAAADLACLKNGVSFHKEVFAF
jgi:ferredoxin-NADP reductase